MDRLDFVERKATPVRNDLESLKRGEKERVSTRYN